MNKALILITGLLFLVACTQIQINPPINPVQNQSTTHPPNPQLNKSLITEPCGPGVGCSCSADGNESSYFAPSTICSPNLICTASIAIKHCPDGCNKNTGTCMFSERLILINDEINITRGDRIPGTFSGISYTIGNLLGRDATFYAGLSCDKPLNMTAAPDNFYIGKDTLSTQASIIQAANDAELGRYNCKMGIYEDASHTLEYASANFLVTVAESTIRNISCSSGCHFEQALKSCVCVSP